jgi:NAD(P)-dependent dehydrogenase (short-subunit alcohol dehydrogenase family)
VNRPEQIGAAVDAATMRFGRIDVLVNNAGYGHLGTVEDVPLEDVRVLFETNFFGLVGMIKAVLPAMRARRSGHIVNIASVGGLVGYPGSGYYCAAKFAVVGLSESLWWELAPLGVKVTVVEPGPFETDFSTRSLAVTAPSSPDYDLAAGFERAGIAHWSRSGGDPALGARAIVAAVDEAAPPLHLVLGREGMDSVRTRAAARLAEFDRWSDLTMSADR